MTTMKKNDEDYDDCADSDDGPGVLGDDADGEYEYREYGHDS